MGQIKILRYGITGLFGALTLLILAVSIAHFSADGAAGLLHALPTGIAAAAAWFIFGFQLKRLQRSAGAVRETMARLAATFFDAPAVLRDGYDVSVTSPPATASVAQAFENDIGYTADGTCGGVKVSVASHSSTLGRQIGELSHVYSYVCVDLLGLDVSFHLTKQGLGSMVAKIGGAQDAKIGDEAFDAAWNVDANGELARAVLDESVQKRLASLRAQVGRVSQDVGVGTMSVIATRHGLAIRWPGELTPELATFMRDLLLDMRKNMLAHVDKKAARIGAEATAAGGYRIAEDGAPPESTEEGRDEERARA